MSNLANLNKILSYVNDGLQFGLDLATPRKAGQTLGNKVTYAGINLFENTIATQEAAKNNEITGSSFCYFAKNQAGGNGMAALQNTMQASLWTLQNQMMYNSMYGMGCCNSRNMWDSILPGSTWGSSFHSIGTPRGSTFIQNNWFG